MRVDDLLNFYRADQRARMLSTCWENDSSKTELKGIVGSAPALLAASILSPNSVTADEPALRDAPSHLFVLDDKESAAYFLNDLQQLIGDTHNVLFFPRSARVPYQEEVTENANIAMRAEVLNEINRHGKGLAIVTFGEAIAEQVISKRELSEQTFALALGEKYTMDFLDEVFLEYRFNKVDFVYEPGQYAVRGGILDVFSYSFDHPYRIEFFGDEVESIRKFDPSSQLSVNKMTRAVVVPNIGDQSLHESVEPLFNFIPADTRIWMADAKRTERQLEKSMERAESAFERVSDSVKFTPPESLFVRPERLETLLKPFHVVEFDGGTSFPNRMIIDWDMIPQPSFNKNFDLITSNLQANHRQGYHNVIVAGQATQIERLHDIFADREAEVPHHPIPIELSQGFVDKSLKLLVYTDHELFERYHRFRLKEGFKKSKQALTLKELSALQPGDYVVHIDHGIGQFGGLQKIDVNGKEQEAIRLSYRGGDVLYVNIHSLHRISKYSSKEGTAPKISKLGTGTWAATKAKTKSRVKELAFDLLKLYAKRKSSKGFTFSPDNYMLHELEASFMFEETPDQRAAIHAVKKDMERSTPMDRLVCGDVGFGKTEVAIRAAFKAAADGKQVAVLVPTTILSMQHYRSFTRRLRDFPVTVDYINRFKTGKKLTETVNKLKAGQVDILIGTHALVGKRVEFKDLGLLVIDEEQKFGVAVKEKLKTIRANVDTLTLTATPIPRTLQFSLMGARDLSTIATPPPNRQPVETTLSPFNEEVIRDAVSYELSRGGQVYFVNNRVKNIQEVAGMISRLVPDARIGIGHGQMDGKQLEDVMARFIDGAFDVLIATTIIESGIDISNANTMIINDAHQFGLSDLHQLRGRVGRSNKKAFCYLLSPPLSLLPDESRKRLQAIEQFSDLGSGIQIAMRDLDIRGAGDLLGGEQSGFISELGFDMYQKILAEAVQELKQESFAELFEEENKASQRFVVEAAIETDFQLMIPDHFVSDIPERISLYRELDDLDKASDLVEFKERLEDRFGPLPRETEDLIETIRLRWLAEYLGMEKIMLKGGKMIAAFIADEDSPFFQGSTFARILNYLKHHARDTKMYQRNNALRMSIENITSPLAALRVLEDIAGLRADEAAPDYNPPEAITDGE
ncbi:MAG: transcription-repair coupling factor [Crocinitomicaceae bacterium]|nr:transcription-repair coupling factor [Crocinitomicaceae bacterium]